MAKESLRENKTTPASSNTEAQESHSQKKSASGDDTRVELIGQQISFIGPLPPPAVFAAYEETLPGAADRILAMAEKQSSHRQGMEHKSLKSSSCQATLGQVFALILALVVILSGGFLIYNDKSVSGLVMILTAIGSLVGLFIYGREKESREQHKENQSSDSS